MLNLQTLKDYLNERIEEKGAYDIDTQDGFDDIANDYSFESYRISDWDLDVDAMSDDWVELIERVFHTWVSIDIIDDVMYVNNNYSYRPNISNMDDLYKILHSIQLKCLLKADDIDIESMLLVAHWLWKIGKYFDDEEELNEYCKKVYKDFVNSDYDYITEYLTNEVL